MGTRFGSDFYVGSSFMWLPQMGSFTFIFGKPPLILKGTKKIVSIVSRKDKLLRVRITSSVVTMQGGNRCGLLFSCSWQGRLMLEQVNLLFLPVHSLANPPAAETVSMQNKPAMNRHPTNSSDGTACHLNCNLQKKQNNTVEKRYSPLTGSYMHPHHPQNTEGSVYISAFPMVFAGLLLQMVTVLIHPDSRRK